MRLSAAEKKEFADDLFYVLGRRDGSSRLKTAAITLIPAVLRRFGLDALGQERRTKAVGILIEKLAVRRSDAALTEVICAALADISRDQPDCRVRKPAFTSLPNTRGCDWPTSPGGSGAPITSGWSHLA